jgi:hypothetical protein
MFKIRGFEGGIWVPKRGGSLNSTGAGLLNHQTTKNSPISFWTKNAFWVYELRGFEDGIGVPKRGRPLNSTGIGLLNHQTSKITLNLFWRKFSLWVFRFEGLNFEGGIWVPKCEGPLNSTGAGLLNQQTSKNSQNGGGIGDLCGGGRGGGGYYKAWRGSGAWYRNPRDDLNQVFGTEDVEPQSSLWSTTTQLSQAPLEHVDVDRGACEESGAKGQFSEHTHGEIQVPTVAEEKNLEVLRSTATTLRVVMRTITDGQTDGRTDDWTMAAQSSVTWTHCRVRYEVTYG